MTTEEFRDRLSARAENAGVLIAADAQARLETYYQLLGQWNTTINLTALPLLQPTDKTFDRLLIEPILAARHVEDSAKTWFDVGSGGGSPAIPLKIVRSGAKLTMIESKARKAAFLREAVRAVKLPEVGVENQRFEDIADRTEPQTIDLVTMRAVKASRTILSAVERVLSPIGRVFLFHSSTSEVDVQPGFVVVETIVLGAAGAARLSVLRGSSIRLSI